MSPRPKRKEVDEFPQTEQMVYNLLDQENPPGPAKHASLNIHPQDGGFRISAVNHDETGNDNIVIFEVGRRELGLLASKLMWHYESRPSLADSFGAFPNFTGGKSSVEYIREMRQE